MQYMAIEFTPTTVKGYVQRRNLRTSTMPYRVARIRQHHPVEKTAHEKELTGLEPKHRCYFPEQSSSKARTSGDPRRRYVPSLRPFRGRTISATPVRGALCDLAWDATLRKAALRRFNRGSVRLRLRVEDLLKKLRMHRPARLLLLVVW